MVTASSVWPWSEDRVWVRVQQGKDDIGKRGIEESLMKGPSTKAWAALAETSEGW